MPTDPTLPGPAPDDTGSAAPSETVAVGDGIRLGQLLKVAGVAESGAHARALLTEGEVTVNGEPEARRGRQLVVGDVVVVALPAGEVRLEVGAGI